MSAYLDEGLKYWKPLTLTNRVLIDTVTTRYESVEAPFIAIDRGEYIELRHSPTIRRVAPYEPIREEAPSIHGLSNGAGGSNGDRS